MSMQLTVSHLGATEKGIALKPGDVVEYKAHLPGGNVRIRVKDAKEDDVAHPGCFKELR